MPVPHPRAGAQRRQVVGIHAGDEPATALASERFEGPRHADAVQALAAVVAVRVAGVHVGVGRVEVQVQARGNDERSGGVPAIGSETVAIEDRVAAVPARLSLVRGIRPQYRLVLEAQKHLVVVEKACLVRQVGRRVVGQRQLIHADLHPVQSPVRGQRLDRSHGQTMHGAACALAPPVLVAILNAHHAMVAIRPSTSKPEDRGRTARSDTPTRGSSRSPDAPLHRFAALPRRSGPLDGGAATRLN